ncbi:MAG: lysophospholipid acyltransferase family protein [Hyphomicrobium sp.]
MSTLRAGAILVGFFALTLPLMPVQAALVRISPAAARRFPNWYHRKVCRLFGVTLDVDGRVASDRPLLLVCNHTSWLDIPVLSALAPVSFVAKKEVSGWPFVSALARLQRTVFIDRARRHATGEAMDEIMARLEAGDTIVLFPEGTSSDGARVLPFKSSLFGAVKRSDTEAGHRAVVQTAAIVYTHLFGVPIARADRPRIGWYGDMEMTSHAWSLLKGGPLRVRIKVSAPVPLDAFADRKALAMTVERQVRRDVHAILRGRPDDETIEPVEPSAEKRRFRHIPAAAKAEKWT